MDSTPASNNADKRKLAQQGIIFALLGWPAADLAVVVGLLISGMAHASASDWLLMLVEVGLIGVLAGLTLWALYRFLRPTVKS
jgi:hypothetical protein